VVRPSNGWRAELDEWNVTLKAPDTNLSCSTEFTSMTHGNFTVTAILYGDHGERIDTVDMDIEVIDIIYNPPPSAIIAMVDKRLRVGELTYFSGSGSNDPNGFIRSYSWDMGDGTIQDGVDVSHLYSGPGFYTVRLIVLDDEGILGETNVVVEVIEAQPSSPEHDKNGSAPSSADRGSIGPEHMVIASMVVVVSLGIALATEVGRTSILLTLLPMYTRLRTKDILDHFTRGKVYGYVIANPGDHLSSIRSSLQISNGTTVYHLRVLERECLLKSRRDGIYKRFYPYEMRVPSDPTGLKESQKMILRTIKGAPGISQRDIASHLGISSSSVSYHMGDLIEEGMVIRQRRGIRLKCFLSPKSESIGL
jgi:predicted transcriptional regulator